MGTWNATCTVTQLPIKEGTKVVMIPLIVKPLDHLARNALAGAGSTSNDILAQPLSLPLRGEYNGSGGIECSSEDAGEPFLKITLDDFVEKGQLYRLHSAEPVLCKKLPPEFMALLSAGDLLVMLPNPRKHWLQELIKLYNESEDKAGLSHYKAQMKVDPASLPEHVVMPLGMTFVSQDLYNTLGAIVGAQPALDRWDHVLEKLDHFDGSRLEQLQENLTPPEKHRANAEHLFKYFTDDQNNPLLEGEPAIKLSELFPMVLKALTPAFYDRSKVTYFASSGAAAATAAAAAIDKNTFVRDELMAFDLFASAFGQMSKMWSPQTTGNDSGLENDLTRVLYAQTSKFIASSCETNATMDFAL